MPSQTISRIDASFAPLRHRAATVQPATLNEADNSVEVIWTTGAAVTRFDWYDGEYYNETLDVTPGAVRLDRLDAGAPVLASHDQGLDALIGSVVPGSVRLDAGKGYARVRFSETPDVANHVAKVKDGHLRAVSVGYLVHTYERHESPNGGRAELRAVDWEPTEISLVTVPADAGAQIRSRSNAMPEIIEGDDRQDDPPRQRRQRHVTADRIREICSRSDDYSRAFERGLVDENERNPMTESDLLHRLSEELAQIHARPSIDSRAGELGRPHQRDPLAQMRQGMADAVFSRLTGTEPGDDAREYRGASLVDMARGLLESRGERVRWSSKAAVLDMALRAGSHTTSDFTQLMGNAVGRYLREAYAATPSPLRALARKRTVPDFREIRAVQLAGPGVLRLVDEMGEFKRTSIIEASEGYKISTYGEIFSVSRQALINDDLGGFQQLAQFWVNAAVENESSLLYALINGSGVTMDDGNALYSSAHANLAGAGGAISVTSLGAARQGMRVQKHPDGSTPANVVPKFLVVGPAKETEAEQALAALAAATQGDVNPFAGKLQLVVDPHISGNSWRLFADPANFPVIEYAVLEGQEELFTDQRAGFDIDGMEFKARKDFGGGVIDWRGTYKDPGN
jgi:HK97 family phage prohead protease